MGYIRAPNAAINVPIDIINGKIEVVWHMDVTKWLSICHTFFVTFLLFQSSMGQNHEQVVFDGSYRMEVVFRIAHSRERPSPQ